MCLYTFAVKMGYSFFYRALAAQVLQGTLHLDGYLETIGSDSPVNFLSPALNLAFRMLFSNFDSPMGQNSFSFNLTRSVSVILIYELSA